VSGSIKRDGDYLVIRLPVSEVQGLRVALQPCSCRAAKSNATAGIRDKLDKGLAKALFAKPKVKAG